MRTTLNLDDDLYEMAMREAEARRLSLGRIISHYVRRGAQAEVKFMSKGGLVLPQLPDDSPMVDNETVRRLDSDQ